MSEPAAMIALGVAPAQPKAGSPTAAFSPRGTVYLPIVQGPPKPEVTPATPPDPLALAFYELLRTDARQDRPQLRWCPTLARAAQLRADGLAGGEPWAHVDSQGRWANEYARQAGCQLPADYAEHGNNIESLVAGSANVLVVFTALANSPSHATHLFGRGDFFRVQNRVGIGLGVGGRFGWYWSVMIGICEGPESGE